MRSIRWPLENDRRVVPLDDFLGYIESLKLDIIDKYRMGGHYRGGEPMYIYNRESIK